MPYEIYGRICIGAVLKQETAVDLHAAFIASLGLPSAALSEAVFDQLRFDTPRHKLHLPDRVRYELAFEAFVDAKYNADCAIGGVAPDGMFEPKRGFIFVGVRAEQFEITVTEIPRHAAAPDRVQWLRKGDMTAGSELVRSLGPDAKKSIEHAARMYHRAAKELLKDATDRVKMLNVSNQHDVDWGLCRWVVDASHASVLHRHGRER